MTLITAIIISSHQLLFQSFILFFSLVPGNAAAPACLRGVPPPSRGIFGDGRGGGRPRSPATAALKATRVLQAPVAACPEGEGGAAHGDHQEGGPRTAGGRRGLEAQAEPRRLDQAAGDVCCLLL